MVTPSVNNGKLVRWLSAFFVFANVITIVALVILPQSSVAVLDHANIKYFLFLVMMVFLLLLVLIIYVKIYPFNVIEAARYMLKLSIAYIFVALIAPLAVLSFSNLELTANELNLSLEKSYDLAGQSAWPPLIFSAFCYVMFVLINKYGGEWVTQKLA